AGFVALDARQPAPFRPPAIAIHDNRDVAGNVFAARRHRCKPNFGNLAFSSKRWPRKSQMTKLEGMTNDQMTKDPYCVSSSFVICAYFVIRHSCLVISSGQNAFGYPAFARSANAQASI